MRVLYYDIETAPILAWVWGLYDQNIQFDSVEQDWHIICAAWQWEGGDVQSITAVGKDDKRVVQKLKSLFDSADVVVAHNGDNFDYKKLLRRMKAHNLQPPKPVTMIDTLKMARKFGFTSRKLGDLAKQLNIENKLQTEKGLWPKAAKGDKRAIKALETYCRGDIPPLRQLYLELRPYAPIKANAGLYTDRPCCPKCASENMTSNGFKVTVAAKRQQWQCKDCGSYTSTTPKVKGAFFK